MDGDSNLYFPQKHAVDVIRSYDKQNNYWLIAGFPVVIEHRVSGSARTVFVNVLVEIF